MAAVCHVESTVPDLSVDHWRVSSFSQDLMLVVFYVSVYRKLSDKGHKRNNSDGSVKLNSSPSLHDLPSTSTPLTVTQGDSGRRQSLFTSAAEGEALSVVEFNRPEV